jgi:hypothetical protein
MRKIDNERKLIEYFKKNLAKGYTIDALKFALINQGYSRTIVERAIQQTTKELSEKAPVLKEKPKIIYEIINSDNKPISIKKPLWKRILGL